MAWTTRMIWEARTDLHPNGTWLVLILHDDAEVARMTYGEFIALDATQECIGEAISEHDQDWPMEARQFQLKPLKPGASPRC